LESFFKFKDFKEYAETIQQFENQFFPVLLLF
jgi:hypothetical protein